MVSPTSLFLVVASLSSLSSYAAPTLVYSLMAQEPPVARVGSLFEFNLFPSTFNSTAEISYTPSGMPEWMSWNSASLAFTGTPSAKDQGETVVMLEARDSTGSTESNFTLITTNYTVPGIHESFTTQIDDPSSRVFSSATPLPGGTGVSIPPYWSFSLGWSGSTFRLSRTEPTNGNLFVMAHERGTVGLPTWLNFDNTTMTFNGTAPAEGTYIIVVTGTDFWGYTGAQTSFVIEVGNGTPIELAKNSNFTDLVTIARGSVDYTIGLENVLYDGEPATKQEVQAELDSTDFPWLSLDG